MKVTVYIDYEQHPSAAAVRQVMKFTSGELVGDSSRLAGFTLIDTFTNSSGVIVMVLENKNVTSVPLKGDIDRTISYDISDDPLVSDMGQLEQVRSLLKVREMTVDGLLDTLIDNYDEVSCKVFSATSLTEAQLRFVFSYAKARLQRTDLSLEEILDLQVFRDYLNFLARPQQGSGNFE